MKTPFKILLAIAALAACVWFAVRQPATAQGFSGGGFVPGPRVAKLLTNDDSGTNVFIAVGGGTAPGPSTNLNGLAVALAVPVGVEACGLMVNCAGTNATTTTNMTITLEFSADGSNWHTNDRVSFVVTPLGVQYAPVYSNLLTASLYGSTFGNVSACRVRSIHHTNTGSIFITNLVITTR